MFLHWIIDAHYFCPQGRKRKSDFEELKVEVLEAKLKYCKAQVRLVEMELDLKDSEKKIETDTDPGIGGGTCIKYGVLEEEMP